MKLEIINKSVNPEPNYENLWDAGADIRSNVNATIAPGTREVIGTGLYISIPEGYEIQIRPRSGLAAKYGVTVLNSPGTIDHGYKGELMVILYNTGTENFKVSAGDRIAQMVLSKVTERIEWSIVSEFTDPSDRGGGLGSTGIE